MEKGERIRKYVARNPQPDQSVCPELVQYWKKRNGRYEEWHSKTGERCEVIPTGRRGRYGTTTNTMSVRGEYYGAYFKADDDMLEITRVWMQGGRGRDGEPKKWRFHENRCFIFKGDPAVYDEKGDVLAQPWQKTYYNDWILGYISDMGRDVYDAVNLMELRHYVESNFGSDAPKIDYLWHFKEFYKMGWMPRKRSKAVQNVLSYKLPEMQMEKGPMQFQIIDDNYAVFRCCHCWDGISERVRIFISKDGKVSIAKSDGGAWRLTPSCDWIPGGNEANFGPEELEAWQPLKWLVPCLQFERTESYHRDHGNAGFVIKQIVQMLRHPIIESLSKSGYPKIAKAICRNNEVPKNLKYYFGAKERKGNLYKVLGVNKWLLKAAEGHTEDDGHSWSKSASLNAIASLKELYGRNDISDLSKETIDAVFPGMVAFQSATSDWKWAIFGDSGWRFRDVEIELTEEQRKKMLKVIKFCTKHPMSAQMFIDTANMKRQMGDAAPDIDIFSFENENDLVRMHNALIELREQQRRVEQARYNAARRRELEEQQKMFEKLQEKRIERYEYEDDEFCIRVPRKLEEITCEGSSLHHCVGTYLDRHAAGSTNIIFLRRKAVPEMSFYTIEICNGRLVQIHGAHNRWLGNNPEAIPFVYEWLQQLGDVKFDVDMLLNRAAGYGKSQDQLDPSYLYRKECVA